MVFLSCAEHNDIIDQTCDARDTFKGLVHLPLEVILGANDPKGQSQELIATKGVVKAVRYDESVDSFIASTQTWHPAW